MIKRREIFNTRTQQMITQTYTTKKSFILSFINYDESYRN